MVSELSIIDPLDIVSWRMTIALDLADVSPSNIEGGAEDSSHTIRSFFSAWRPSWLSKPNLHRKKWQVKKCSSTSGHQKLIYFLLIVVFDE